MNMLAPHPVPAPQVRTARQPERIVFLGTPQIAVPTLEALAETPLRPIAVITEPDKPVGRKQVRSAPPVKRAAEALGVPVYQPATAAELQDVVQALQPTLGVVVAYGRILKPAVLAVPTRGFVNLHFSRLPAYRGATPIQAALLHGDTETGVSLMQLDPGLDTGPLLGYAPTDIAPTETAGSLGERLADIAATVATELLPKLLANELSGQPQPESSDPATRRLSKDDGAIDWSWPAAAIERFVRAMQPWPKAWTEQAGERIIIHSAHLAGDRLIIDAIQVAGGRVITGSEFARGYPAALTALRETGKVAPTL